uniref:Uncharacterized protein LOC108041385 n=1 Tax=Drosophila rhopaloa TaxID=1041015 RepID=A0A6P4EIG9_DRORH
MNKDNTFFKNLYTNSIHNMQSKKSSHCGSMEAIALPREMNSSPENMREQKNSSPDNMRQQKNSSPHSVRQISSRTNVMGKGPKKQDVQDDPQCSCKYPQCPIKLGKGSYRVQASPSKNIYQVYSSKSQKVKNPQKQSSQSPSTGSNNSYDSEIWWSSPRDEEAEGEEKKSVSSPIGISFPRAPSHGIIDYDGAKFTSSSSSKSSKSKKSHMAVIPPRNGAFLRAAARSQIEFQKTIDEFMLEVGSIKSKAKSGLPTKLSYGETMNAKNTMFEKVRSINQSSHKPKDFKVSAQELVSFKIIAPFIQKFQEICLNTMKDSLALTKELEKIPKLISEIYGETVME